MKTSYESGLRVSEYVLEQRVGTGTFGEVWRARHHVWSDDLVAIKLPTAPEYVRYLQHEGVVVHGLRHPNIVRVIGLDPFADMPYLVMELVRGPALREVIDSHPTGLPIEVVMTMLRGVLGAMQIAHEAGVLHRDLKPGNVLLNLEDRAVDALEIGDVKVSDFGLGVADASTLQSIAQSASLDRDDRLVGTIAYMAPEVRDDRHKHSPASDLYSIGVMLFEMLTGERPAGAELPSTIRASSPAVFDEVFRKLYARADRRYATAAEVLHDLDRRQPPMIPAARATETPKRKNAPTPPPIPHTTRPGGRRSCPTCGQVLDGDDQFCTQCGYQVTARVRRCPSCGGFPGSADKFCIFCGKRLPRDEGAA